MEFLTNDFLTNGIQSFDDCFHQMTGYFATFLFFTKKTNKCFTTYYSLLDLFQRLLKCENKKKCCPFSTFNHIPYLFPKKKYFKTAPFYY